ncbi:MAG: N-acetylmuramoyl-L-alanine amidase [Gemmatimonadota bacterium]|nr:N-acetylmuramoyl-L-alanine amidase [Gemmatimonadota bacterium]MDQ3606635.1 N-acetylmuramoyl-L-alanine amidase [Gemmatimonadota bacterium]
MPGKPPSQLMLLPLLLALLLGSPSLGLAQRNGSSPADAPRLVIIDAGHGGVDKGATGPGGTREKDVALAIARQLAELLREAGSYEVRLTRERDTLVALRDRTRMANAWRGDGGREALFISIHCNASDHRTARGVETFFLSEARTADARRVADRENSAQRFESDAQQMDPLSFILRDLQQNKYLRDSSDGAALIQARLASTHAGPNRGVKQAGFVVLDGAFMPAVLVEIGFLTNPTEERLLRDREHQRQIARSLARGIGDYFARPSGARLANDS